MYSRRESLEVLCLGGCGLTLPVCASALSAENKQIFRFAVASDLHFGQKKTPYEKNVDLLVSSLNQEKAAKGLDAVFLNGDIVNDSATAYEELKRNHLQRLDTPYYAIKGNHDYVDGRKGSPGESWDTIWGYPSNHVVRSKGLAFILADTTAPRQSDQYLPADIDWLEKQLRSLENDPVVFVFMHIAQREKGVQGWPAFGVGDKKHLITGEAVMTLLESHNNVRAIFHGHNHNEAGRYISGSKPYFFDSRNGGSWGNRIGYRIVEIDSDKSMTTYQYNMEDAVIMNRHVL